MAKKKVVKKVVKKTVKKPAKKPVKKMVAKKQPVEKKVVNAKGRGTPALELKNVCKTFGTVKAIDHGQLTLYKGEILALLGENGSGKTSLMNVIAGIYYPDSGTVTVNGEPAKIHSPHEAYKYHIGMVHQHFKLVDNFTGIDNILLGHKEDRYQFRENWHKVTENKKAVLDGTDKASKRFKAVMTSFGKHCGCIAKKMGSGIGVLSYNRGQGAIDIARRYGFKIDLNKRISEMSVSEKQTVEIIKTLYRGVDILILDEPTAVLTPQEITGFFNVLRKMKKDGKSIIIITHKLNEVMAVSDRVTILRKGRYIDTVKTKDTNEQELTNMMVGQKTTLKIERKKCKDVEPRLYVNNLIYINEEGKRALDDVSFVAKSGEILGIAGIAGSGQKELLQVLSGIEDCESGSLVYYHPKRNKPVTLFHKSVKRIMDMAEAGMFHYYDTGKPVSFVGKRRKEIIREIDDGEIIFNDDEIMNVKGLSPRQMKELGIRSSFVPEDRLGMGLVANMSVVDNMMLRNYRKGRFGLLNTSIPAKLSREVVNQLKVKTPSLKTQVSKLSGGNIQKLLVGREIASSPYVLTAAYPVRGLDINSSYAIYDLLNKQKEKGCAIIFVGEDLDVMLALCDRIVVMCGGRITGEVDARTTTKEEVGRLMTLSKEEVQKGGK